MTTWQKIRLFFSPLKEFPIKSLILLWYSLFSSIYAILLVFLLGSMTDAIVIWDFSTIRIYLWILFLFILVNYIAKIFYRPTNFRVFRDVALFLEKLYLQKFISADNNQVEKVGIWRMISIVHQGIYMRTITLLEFLRDKAISFFTILMTVIIIGIKSWQFLLICMILIFLSIPFLHFFWNRAYFRRRKVKNINVELDRMSVRWFMSKFEMQQQDKYDHEISKRSVLRDDWYMYKYREKFQQALGYDTLVLSTEILLLAVAWFVGFNIITWYYSIGDFVLLTWLALLFQRELSKLLQEIRKMQDNIIHVEKLVDTFADLQSKKSYTSWKKFTYKGGQISLENIHYGYEKEDVFSAFSLDIAWWKKTALVWSSGGGKSTLIKIIAWYLSVDKGIVSIDGQDLDAMQLKSYYRHIGYLTQEPSVFDGTIYENLSYALDYIPSKEEIDAAITSAWCEFVYDLSQWLETEIGERGVRLSGWQKQRLAISKIFLKNPEIILLDEPTSALDSVSEEKVSQALNRLFVGRTVIIIAHRLQTVKEADDIIVIEHGEVVERGTHTQLRKKKWVYAKMLELQTTF